MFLVVVPLLQLLDHSVAVDNDSVVVDSCTVIVDNYFVVVDSYSVVVVDFEPNMGHAVVVHACMRPCCFLCMHACAHE